jgi:acetyl esterase/lipase
MDGPPGHLADAGIYSGAQRRAWMGHPGGGVARAWMGHPGVCSLSLVRALSMLRMRIRGVALVLAVLHPLLLSPAQAQQTVLPLWPHALPQPAQTDAAEIDISKPTDIISGHHTSLLTNITHPTLTVYAPSAARNTHAAAVVFPGGGYYDLAWDGEGLDTCGWLNRLGMTCILVKYRVPEKEHFPANPADLEDAQQAMRITRAHAAEWHIDPNKIGVMGFSAGGNLAALLSLHPDDHSVEHTPAAADVDANIDARPNFAILVYPAYLAIDPEQVALDPVYTPSASTPRTFIVAAENDLSYGKNSLVYYRALVDAQRPAELHMYPNGGHGFGMFPTGAAAHWTSVAAEWLRGIHVLPPLPPPPPNLPSTGGAPMPPPCPLYDPPVPGRPSSTAPDPNCI